MRKGTIMTLKEFEFLIEKNEDAYEKSKTKQNLDENSVWYGFYYDNETVVEHTLPLYLCKASKYYKSEELLRRMNLNMDFLLRMQFPNGLISLWNCNIISAPDTAFVIISLAVSLELIEKKCIPELEELKNKISQFLKNTIPGMISGGFHTPNHRWIISCALAFLYNRFGDERLKTRINEFSAEGLDINDCGEWTERSNGGYNGVVDLCCYHIAEIIGIDKFYDAAYKNLNMMKYMLHCGDYIATEYSSRQDRGVKTKLSSWYACAYFLMAVKEKNSEFMCMAYKAMKGCKNTAKILIYLMLYENKLKELPKSKEISEDYLVVLNQNGVSEIKQKSSLFGDAVVRYRKNDLSITVMAGQPDFMYIQHGKARAVSVKLPIGWFGLGGASFVNIEQLGEKCFKLKTPLCGDYMQVLNAEMVSKFDGNYTKMPNSDREKINKVDNFVEIILEIKDDGVDMDISMGEMPYIFTQLVIGFDKDGTLYGENLENMSNGVVRPKDGIVTYIKGDNYIEIKGESTGHNYEFIRGDTLNNNTKNVVFNALSPKKWHIGIKCGKRKGRGKNNGL